MWKLVLISGLLPAFVHAGTLELKQDGRTIFLQEKPGWKLSKDLFGMPYIYFSPGQNGQRTNISFTDTGASAEITPSSLKKSTHIYEDSKKKWAKKVGATAEDFLPYEVSSNKHGHRVHKIGFTFLHEGKEYLERSFYIECRGEVLFSKSLRLKENDSHEQQINELINDLDCGGV